jgi:hypothetical protein
MWFTKVSKDELDINFKHLFTIRFNSNNSNILNYIPPPPKNNTIGWGGMSPIYLAWNMDKLR